MDSIEDGEDSGYFCRWCNSPFVTAQAGYCSECGDFTTFDGFSPPAIRSSCSSDS